MARKPTVPVDFHTGVFVNCPFDDEHLALLHAIVFTIVDCGFTVRTALDEVGGELRLLKIARMMDACRLSIHDVSAVRNADAAGSPRLNMAFECGVAYGARYFDRGSAHARDFLVLARDRDVDGLTLSDLDGCDRGYHRDLPEGAIAEVRSFLAGKAIADRVTIRDHANIVDRWRRFEAGLPAIVADANVRVSPELLVTRKYLSEWTSVAATWIASTTH